MRTLEEILEKLPDDIAHGLENAVEALKQDPENSDAWNDVLFAMIVIGANDTWRVLEDKGVVVDEERFPRTVATRLTNSRFLMRILSRLPEAVIPPN